MYHISFKRFLSNEIEFLLFSNRPTSPKFKRAWIQLPIMMSDRNWIICWHCFIRGPILQSLINGRRRRLSALKKSDRGDHSSDSQPTNPIWIIYRWNPSIKWKGVSPSLFFPNKPECIESPYFVCSLQKTVNATVLNSIATEVASSWGLIFCVTSKLVGIKSCNAWTILK